MNFTDAQREAIAHREGNLQLVACAGSGKTEVVARHVALLLDRAQPAPLVPNQIVAFTFTEKAAAELKERIFARSRERNGDVVGLAELYVGTIHAFCLDLLRTEAPEFLKFSVLNEVQQVLLVDRYSAQSGLTSTTDLAGKKLERYKDTRRYISALNILREARTVPAKLDGCSVSHGLALYRNLLKSKCYLDYTSIMEEAVALLRDNAVVRARIAARVRRVIVDEYQDVNPVQEQIVQLLHGLGASVCVVGDDDQTLYQWRGADVRNILTFATRYPGVHQVRLEENFRSSRAIVELARDFIRSNTERLPKAMVPTDAQSYDTGDVEALAFLDADAEAQFIARKIQELRGVALGEGDAARGMAYSDVAILLRSVKANGAAIAQALEVAGIPYVITGMNNLFETREARAARALFYFLAGRNDTDEVALRGAWTEAELGLDDAMLDAAIAGASATRDALSEPDPQRWNLYNLQRVYMRFVEDTQLREVRVPAGRGEVVFYNLGKFSQLISDFETIHFHSAPVEKYQAFASFLQYGAEEAYPEGWQDHVYANPDAVRIMTIHQSKGMQWPVVIVPALLRNRFPAAKVGGAGPWHIIPRAAVVDQDRYEGSIEDERRLFYVAATRAQKFLFLTWGPIAGKHNRYSKASEFWEQVLESKWVKRRDVALDHRPRLEPAPRASVANVTFTFSELKYFFECAYQFKLRVLYGFNAPLSEALGYGKSLHDALADVHLRAMRGQAVGPADVPLLVATHLHLPYAYPALREKLEESASQVLLNYLADNAKLFDRVEYAEKAIEISLGDGVSVAGRVDLIYRRDTEEVSIVDLKSNSRSQAEDVTETQLSIYSMGYEALTGRAADYVETYELEERKRKPRAVDRELADDIRTRVQAAAGTLRGGQLEAEPHWSKCRLCDFCRMCSASGAVKQVT